MFAAGPGLTSFTDPELGHVAVTVCYDGDFPEVASALAARGADLVIQPAAYEWEARAYWDRYYPGPRWPTGSGGCWSTSAGPRRRVPCSGPARSSRRRAARCSPRRGGPAPPPAVSPEPELLLGRLEETEDTKDARAFAEQLRAGRRGDIYGSDS